MLLDEITARQVLEHRTGLPNWATVNPLARTGSSGKWQYSGEAFLILQQAVEHMTKEPLDRWINEAVFRPLAMRESSFHWEDRFVAREAIGHDDKGRALPPDHYQFALALSTKYTTLTDYFSFMRAAFASADTLFCQQLTPVNPDHGLWWALGVGVEKTASRQEMLHGGSNPGFRSYFWFDPVAKSGMLFFTNRDRGYELATPPVTLSLPGVHPALTAEQLHLPK